ncbi:hypothetical protein HNR23_001534 [Nocardiopsis mwathae]|uniref:Pyridoxamine 5'-phosphate oxidase family protein n=1 Tax=Nocardiopsis mwathae TaxID=1472723 RepID=A0A7W9YG00_9ACTN|nr:hypothetical protein [Nocardiopsis mwathae]
MSSTAAPYPATPRTTPTRARERAHYDHATVHAILDSDYICHLGFVSADGGPIVLPTTYARVGSRLYLHGSTGSRPLRGAAEGLRVCVTVTRTDGLVLARSGMHHSLNYRSVVAHGTAHRVTDPDEHRTALDAIIDRIVPGRAADCRPATAKELAQTAVIRLDLREVSAKVRTGGVNDEPEDRDLPTWAGVIPVSRTLGTPVPDPAMSAETPLPDYLRRLLAEQGLRRGQE